MFGTFQLQQFEECKLTPGSEEEKAWKAVKELVGVGYKCLLYVGNQVAKGSDYVFVAEQTFQTKPPIRRVVSFTVNCINGVYELVDESLEVIAQ